MLIRPIVGGLVAAMLVGLVGCGGSSLSGAGLGTIRMPVSPAHAEETAPGATSCVRVQPWADETGTNRSDEKGAVGSVPAGLGIESLARRTPAGAVATALRYAYERDCPRNIGAPFGHCNANGVDEAFAVSTGNFSPYSLVARGAGTALGIAFRALAPKVAVVTVGPRGIIVSGRF